ncbi:hypothetical protein V5799_029599 [Amblyomma americanum]|uniref:Uncharacterized protein n=1 Tax=Amblyomma americanum TaxID=6943 RepID=A0AAQ4EQR3_AMBAM
MPMAYPWDYGVLPAFDLYLDSFNQGGSYPAHGFDPRQGPSNPGGSGPDYGPGGSCVRGSGDGSVQGGGNGNGYGPGYGIDSAYSLLNPGFGYIGYNGGSGYNDGCSAPNINPASGARRLVPSSENRRLGVRGNAGTGARARLFAGAESSGPSGRPGVTYSIGGNVGGQIGGKFGTGLEGTGWGGQWGALGGNYVPWAGYNPGGSVGYYPGVNSWYGGNGWLPNYGWNGFYGTPWGRQYGNYFPYGHGANFGTWGWNPRRGGFWRPAGPTAVAAGPAASPAAPGAASSAPGVAASSSSLGSP